MLTLPTPSADQRAPLRWASLFVAVALAGAACGSVEQQSEPEQVVPLLDIGVTQDAGVSDAVVTRDTADDTAVVDTGGVGPGVVRSPIVPVPCGVGADRGGEAAALATATRARSFLFIFISPTARFRRSIADPPFRRRLTDEPDPDHLFFAAVARGHTRAGDTTADGAAREQPRARDVERGAQRVAFALCRHDKLVSLPRNARVRVRRCKQP